ncbi:hypothetical protein [Loktanella sp. M215]|uniref:hypothetical protein n=1 Tax=Loktanella sp. M215 TaxID=2675431 RepID=UPI001F3D756B|nr:hypothetical protein [Loktanella sp. M215]MCF7701063.1 hypothetical protein [Loktanella sp. M215]
MIGRNFADLRSYILCCPCGLALRPLALIARDDTSAASVHLEKIMDKHGTPSKSKQAPKPATTPDTIKAKQPDQKPQTAKK